MKNALSKKWSPAGDLDTPYKKAVQEWDRRMGDSVARARNWRLAFFTSILFIAFPCVIGLIYLGALPKSVPHIIEISADGSAEYRGAIGKSWANYKPSQASVIYHLQRFINDTRTVSSDPAVIKKNWLDAYDLVTPSAGAILNTYANEKDPFTLASTQRVSIEISSSVPISSDTWQIDWTEKSWGLQGNLIETTFWRGIFNVGFIAPKKESEFLKNPIGIYINEFHWSKINR
jgi:type IV secretion system protein TrbF